LAAAKNRGTFHGVMAATTPTGSLVTITGPRSPSFTWSKAKVETEAGVVVQDHGRGQHLGQGAHDTGEPISLEISSAMPCMSFAGWRRPPWSGSRPARRGPCAARGRGRGPGGRRPPPGRCRRSAPPGPARPTSSLEGDTTSKVADEDGSTQSPPMNRRSYDFMGPPSMEPVLLRYRS